MATKNFFETEKKEVQAIIDAYDAKIAILDSAKERLTAAREAMSAAIDAADNSAYQSAYRDMTFNNGMVEALEEELPTHAISGQDAVKDVADKLRNAAIAATKAMNAVALPYLKKAFAAYDDFDAMNTELTALLSLVNKNTDTHYASNLTSYDYINLAGAMRARNILRNLLNTISV